MKLGLSIIFSRLLLSDNAFMVSVFRVEKNFCTVIASAENFFSEHTADDDDPRFLFI